MSTSYSVHAFKPADERWERMKLVWDACEAAEVAPPVEVDDFFAGQPPSDNGVDVKLTSYPEDGDDESITRWDRDGAWGFDVDIRKLPADTHIVRFQASY